MPDRMMPPPLELATFVADDVVLTDATAWEDGRLHIDRRLAPAAVADRALASVQVEIVRPGDPVRIANVLDAVLPDVKPDEPERRSRERWAALALARTRPHEPARRRGRAVGMRLAGCRDTRQRRSSPTRWSTWRSRRRDDAVGRTTNVVVRCGPAPGAPIGDVDRAVRRATLAVARDLAATTIGEEPSRVETIRNGRAPTSTRPSGDVRDPAGRVRGTAHRHVPLRDARSEGSVPTLLDRGRAARRRADERRVRLAGRPQRHRELPGLVARPRRSSRATASGCGSPGSSSRSATWTPRSRSSARRCSPPGSRSGWGRRERSARRSRPATPTPTRCSPCGRADRSASDHGDHQRDERRAHRSRRRRRTRS